jgi:WD40 repeat protein
MTSNLNNHAVDLLGLGRQEEAEAALEEILDLDSTEPEALFNRGLLLWRSGRLTDVALVRQLEENHRSRPEDWRPGWLLGLVHIERGDAESAIKVLEDILPWSNKDALVTAALEKAKYGIDHWGGSPRILEGHANAVCSVAISPDGQSALSGGSGSYHSGSDVRQWDLPSGKCLQAFEVHKHFVSTVAISPDGQTGLSGGYEKKVHLWDLATGKCLKTFKKHKTSVRSIVVSSDGRLMLSGSSDNRSAHEGSRERKLRLWDLTTGKLLRTFKRRSWGVDEDIGQTVAICSQGQRGFSGGYDGLYMWDLVTGKCLWTRECHENAGHVESVACSPDGMWGLSGSSEGTLCLWDLASGECLRTFQGHKEEVSSVAVSPDGRLGLSGSLDYTLRLWDLASGKCLRTFEGHTGIVWSVAIAPDGRFALSGSADHTLRLWDLAIGSPAEFAKNKRTSADEATFKASLLEAEQTLEADHNDQAIAIIDKARKLSDRFHCPEALDLRYRAGASGQATGLASAYCSRIFEGHECGVASVAIFPDGERVLSTSGDKTLRCWDLTDAECLQVLEMSDMVRTAAISSDGQTVFLGGGNSLYVWDLMDGDCLEWAIKNDEVPGIMSGNVSSVACSPDGRWGLSGIWGAGNWCKELRLWDLASGECLRTFEGHHYNVNSVAISPDGRMGLSGGFDKTVRLWDLAEGECLRVLRGHTSSMESVAISPNGQYALSGSSVGFGFSDSTIRLWDLTTGKCLRYLRGHTDTVSCLSFSPNGRFALSGSEDETIRVWDLTNCKCLRTFETPDEKVTSIAFSPNGRFAVSGSIDTTTVRLWEFVWNYEFPESADWDDGARPYLEAFLTLHCSYGDDGISRVGGPIWSEEDYMKLLTDLQYRGYGWLRPGGVRKKLEDMTNNWQGPSTLSREPASESPAAVPSITFPRQRDYFKWVEIILGIVFWIVIAFLFYHNLD